ncbi:MAG: hypothetical protein WC365_09915 [Candidatus Babeliales bacterium]|jgi:Zn finger protein HypA/HybF involved in hydrogenase expression
MRERIKAVQTRKRHKCWGCGLTIEEGELAYKFFAVGVDGYSSAIHGYFCPTCERQTPMQVTHGSEMRIRD